MTYLCKLMFNLSVCGFCLNYKYYLKSLIMIEFVVLSIMIVLLDSEFCEYHYLIYVLILGVCESVLGLLLVIYMYRFWGIDSYLLVDFNF